jgi:argininosuccinate lyase
VLTGTLASTRFDPDRAAAAIDASVLASDVAERLASAGMPFRAAHHAVGRLVQRAEQLGVSLADLGTDEIGSIEPSLAPEWKTLFDRNSALERRAAAGGSSAAAVQAQIAAARRRLAES